MLEHQLQQLGLSVKQVTLYLSLAEKGPASATELSKRCKIPRATVYLLLEELIERDIVLREESPASTTFSINHPSCFLRLVESQREELKERENSARDVADLLTPFFKKTRYTIPRLQFVEGKAKIEHMLYEYLPEWRRSYAEIKEFTLWGYQDHSFVEQYRKWHDHLWSSSTAKENIRLFSNPSDIEKELMHRVPGREVRALPAGIQFSSSIWIYGDYILMAMTRQTPHYALHLKDAVFAANLRAIFQLLWRARF